MQKNIDISRQDSTCLIEVNNKQILLFKDFIIETKFLKINANWTSIQNCIQYQLISFKSNCTRYSLM